MEPVKQRYDLFEALKGRIHRELAHYNDPKNVATFSQPVRVIGRKEGYEHVLQLIDEMLNMDVVTSTTNP